MNSNTSNNPQSTTPSDGLASASAKKVRKPYTITKSRESWTEEEHDKFLEALQLSVPSSSSSAYPNFYFHFNFEICSILKNFMWFLQV